MRKIKRKWGSPAQRLALKKMLAAGRLKRRPTRRRQRPRHIANPKEKSVTKKRRRSSGRRARHATRSVRRSGRSLGGFVPAGTPMMVLGATAGMIVPDFVLSKIPLPESLRKPAVALAVKGALILGVGYFAKRFVGNAAAAAFVFGGIAGIVAPLVKSRLGLSGVGDTNVSPQLGQAGGRYVQDAEGRVYQVA